MGYTTHLDHKTCMLVLFRDAGDGKFKLFKDNQSAPTTTVNTSNTGYAVATLVANLEVNYCYIEWF